VGAYPYGDYPVRGNGKGMYVRSVTAMCIERELCAIHPKIFSKYWNTILKENSIGHIVYKQFVCGDIKSAKETS
jgi:hypothetical protein